MPDLIKQNGVHYTPKNLATFLARQTLGVAGKSSGFVDVLDPACGDGNLLVAIATAATPAVRRRMRLFGFEQDPAAAEQARSTLASLDVAEVQIVEQDFLSEFECVASNRYDIVIANPPYVRTQVLGAASAQSLAKRFGLTGRVDLYHAFSIAMSGVLREGGTLGLLTSNRFLTIKSGIDLRRSLHDQFEIASVIDLGDTKLFSASVLPVIVVGRKKSATKPSEHQSSKEVPTTFSRVYESRAGVRSKASASCSNVLDALNDHSIQGQVETKDGVFEIQRGRLNTDGQDSVWTLSTPQSDRWLKTVARHQAKTFADVAQVRVGIKSTADAVFIREDWQALEPKHQPEQSLIHPLITHHDAGRWSIAIGAATGDGETATRKSVLYPHVTREGRRVAVDLSEFPRTASYLSLHRERLEGRRYVIEGGREWYEIWVPHDPSDWAKPKVVFPDIAEHPTFFWDESGAIVNGDCYWITLKNGVPKDWLYLILAIGNSSFITEFYDHLFFNKLYAGRRRFMTQYVKQFPLPDLENPLSRKIVSLTKRAVRAKREATRAKLETQIDALVSEAFGVA